MISNANKHNADDAVLQKNKTEKTTELFEASEASQVAAEGVLYVLWKTM